MLLAFPRRISVLALCAAMAACGPSTDQSINNIDSDGDGIPDHLDPDFPGNNNGNGNGNGNGGNGNGGNGNGGNGNGGNGNGGNGNVDIGQSSCGAPAVGGMSGNVADFEGSSTSPEVIATDNRNGSWFTYPSSVSMSVANGGAGGSSRALVVKATSAPGTDAGFGMNLNARLSASCAYNATAFSGVAFWIRGTGVTTVPFMVGQGWTTPLAGGGTCKTDCYNHHYTDVAVTTEWQRVEVKWSDLKAAGWGQTVPFDARQLTQLLWGLPSNAAFEVAIDGVEFLPGGTLDTSLPPGYGGGSTDTPIGASPACKPDSFVVDDLEGPEYSSYLWYTVPTNPANNGSVEEPLVVEGPNGGHAVHVKGSGYPAGLTVARTASDVGVCFTSQAGGLKFRASSEKARDLIVRVRLKGNTPVSEGGTCEYTEQTCARDMGECCYDYHSAKVRLSTGWNSYEVPFTNFYQEGFAKQIDLTLAEAVGFDFEITDAGSFDVWFDDIGLLPSMGTGPVGQPCASNPNGNIPFGSKPVQYASGITTPSGVSDQSVRERYNQWLANYVVDDCGGKLVHTADISAYTVSEAMGYGMILAAFMNDKPTFDGLWKVTRNYSSRSADEFMAWRLEWDCAPVQSSDWQSATDGDMDIAYALMLADRQWGSGGSINYRDWAYKIINRLANVTLATDQSFIKLGDWVSAGSGTLATAMRPSDFMPDHFRAFYEVTGDSRWLTALDKIYSSMSSVQGQMNGLFPDFVVNANSNPSPAPGQVLEGAFDGTYATNACRVPWRLGVDFLMNGEQRAKTMLNSLSNRAKSLSGGNPGSFVGKYYPDGDYYSADTQGALFYIGPLGVGAMVAGDQSWTDALWARTRDANISVYYQDTLRVLSMIAMSGNWWSPHKVSCN